MAYEFRLPDIGEGLHEAEVLQWFVKIGDDIKADQPVVEVQTDKAAVEIASPVGGRVSVLGGQAGDTIKVGEILIAVDTSLQADAKTRLEVASTATASPTGTDASAGGVDGSSTAGPSTAAASSPTSPVASSSFTVSIGGAATPSPESLSTPAVHTASLADPSGPVVSPAVANGLNHSLLPKRKVQAAPAVRKLAHDLGVSLEAIIPSGPNGRVTRADVERAADLAKQQVDKAASSHSNSPASPPTSAPSTHPASPAALAPSTPLASPAVQGSPAAFAEGHTGVASAAGTGPAADRREPIRGLRKRIYQNMAKSMYTAPQATGMDELNATRLVELRQRLLPHAESRGIRLTYLPIIIKAVTYVLREYPIFNASVDDDAMEIVYKGAINIGIATATPEGLLVPVIRNADSKSIFQIASQLEDLTNRGRHRKLELAELTGSTFTITSTGANGGWFATPIVNHPEVAILGVHTIEKRAVVLDDDSIVPQQRMTYSLTFDHRVIDGEPAGRFMHRLKEYLENPELMLAL